MRKIIETINKEGTLHREIVAQNQDKYTFTLKELDEYIGTFMEVYDLEKYEYTSSSFTTFLLPFNTDGNNYYLRVMIGQGTAFTFYTEEAWMAFDEYLKTREGDRELRNEVAATKFSQALQEVLKEEKPKEEKFDFKPIQGQNSGCAAATLLALLAAVGFVLLLIL